MHVTVFGKNVEVEVSSTGMFFDSKTKKLSSRTLKGLQKKIQEAWTPKGNVLVEKKDTGKKGTAIGYVGTRWSSEYTVVWEDNSRTTEGDWTLRKPTTPEDRVALKAAEAVVTNIQGELEKAEEAQEELESKFEVKADLQKHFPRK